MTNERQLITFEANETEKISTGIKRLQHDGTLMAFKNLSEAIKTVTGLLSEKFIPILQNLSASYSTTSHTIKLGLADSSAILSKFVIKSWHIIQRGMNKVDEDALINIGNQLNTGFKNELAKFVNLSTSDLGNIHTELLARAADGNITNLLKEKDDLEIELLRRSEEITNKSFVCGENQGKIDSIKHHNQADSKVIQTSKDEKLEMEAERSRLETQIPDYEENVRKHLDTCSIQRKGIWPFIRKQKVCQDNGETIARENLNRLRDRINDLERRLKTWSSVNVKKPTKKIPNSLKKYRTKKFKLEKELQKLQQSHDQVKQKFDNVTQQINAIYQLTGTVNVRSIQAVDELSRALENGAQAFISACSKIENHLARIQQYPNELADAVLDALKLINIADEYNDSTKIKDIKQVLGVE